MTTHPYALIDVFTDRPLAGNQLAVFMDADDIDESNLQAIAKEMNLSETVFVFPADDNADARVRYFSSTKELPFAGHPTLGTASIVADERLDAHSSTLVRLETRKGVVPIDVRRDGPTFVGWMTQPIPTITPWEKTDELLAVLGVSKPFVPVEVYDAGLPHVYIVLEDIREVAAIVPDFTAMRQLGDGPCINVLAGSGTSYLTRMFSPFDAAMPEDPATGSAAGPLSAHLVRHELVQSGVELTISQGEFVGRPSTLQSVTEVSSTGVIESIRVGGKSVIVGRGELYL